MARKTSKDPEQKIVQAALDLAESKGWAAVSLAAIARRAKVTLAVLHTYFENKADILGALARHIDAQTLKNHTLDLTGSYRETLFDVLMKRFDVLNARRPTLIAIVVA